MIILVPTRGRPFNALRLLDALTPDIESGSTSVLFCGDDDDPTIETYKMNLMITTAPRMRLGPCLNYYSKALADRFDIIGFLGDDVMPRTDDWINKIKAAMVPNGIVYANDGHQGENLPTAVFMDARLIRKLGYMVPPGFTHLFIDNFWAALGKRLGTLTYLPDVYLEHLHPHAGKADNDSTYEDANSGQMWAADEAAFNDFIQNKLEQDVQRLKF